MSFPATPASLAQVRELYTLAREFRYYADGVKIVKNAKAFRQSFKALEDGIYTVNRRMKPVETTAKKAGEIANRASKITDLLQKGLFKQINPVWGARLNLYLTLANLGVSAFIIKKNEEIQELNIQSQKITEAGLSDAFTRTINNSIQIKNIREQIKVQENDFKEELLKQEIQNNFFRKQINDITYEVREGRKKVEARVNEQINNFNKFRNDITYEVREGRRKLEAQVSKVVSDANQRIQDASKTVAELQRKLTAAQQVTDKRISSVDASTAKDIKALEAQTAKNINKLETSVNNARKDYASLLGESLEKIQKQIRAEGFTSRETEARINRELNKKLATADAQTTANIQSFQQQLNTEITKSEFERDKIKNDIQKLLLDKNKSDLLEQRFIDLEKANKKSSDILNNLISEANKASNQKVDALSKRVDGIEQNNQNRFAAINGKVAELQKLINQQGYLSPEVRDLIFKEVDKAIEGGADKSLEQLKSEIDKRLLPLYFEQDKLRQGIQSILLDKNKTDELREKTIALEKSYAASQKVLNEVLNTSNGLQTQVKQLERNDAKQGNQIQKIDNKVKELDKKQEETFTVVTRHDGRIIAIDKYSQDTRFLITRVNDEIVNVKANINGQLKDIDRKTFEKLKPEIKRETKAQVTTTIQPQIEQLKQADRTLDNRLKTTERQADDIERQLEKTVKPDINTLKTKIKEREKVDKEANNKLGQILGLTALIPAIPARAAGLITPTIPTPNQIQQATGTAICNSLNGGCAANAVNQINRNTNNQLGNILNGLNTGANAAQLTLLNTINNKLGAQLPGGLSATFGRLWQTLQIDRILNVLILISTFHNALMLSNNIAQTLFSVFDNIGQTIGFKWKNEKGEEVGFGGLVSEWTSNFFKTIFGEENYTSLVSTYKKANRIYQAGANLLSSITNMSDVILNSIEYLAGQSAKVANALRNFRVVGERAYEVFNPQPNLKWGIFNKLQKGQESADFLLQVSQIPIEITQAATEFNESATELAKAIKEDPEVPSGTVKIEDAAQTKEKETKVKEASISLALSDIDLEADE